MIREEIGKIQTKSSFLKINELNNKFFYKIYGGISYVGISYNEISYAKISYHKNSFNGLFGLTYLKYYS